MSIAVAGGLLVIGMVGTASANDVETPESLYNGSKAFSYHNGCFDAHGRGGVSDIRADGYAVYAEYYRGAQFNRIDNNNGASGLLAWTPCGTPVISSIRGCTNRPLIPDVCSNWETTN